ncbi:hypothetical protein H0H92_008939, partial [Tricholoma furcatifolium]
AHVNPSAIQAGCTPDSRAEEHYICYDKARRNALNITCRIPTEILASIFRLVVDLIDSDHYPQISHVCSHWRVVALSTLTLWFTIYVDFPTWAVNKLERSKTAPLSVICCGKIYKETYNILHEILTSHLHRVKDLAVGCLGWDTYPREIPSRGKTISLNDFQKLLQLLGQHNGPLKIERIEMSSSAALTHDALTRNALILTRDASGALTLTRDDGLHDSNAAYLMLPDNIVTSPYLKYLSFHDLRFNWELVHTFNSLKTFKIFRIPPQSQPSMAQFLRFLSQMPVLKSLYFMDINQHQDSPYDCLKRLAVSCSLPSIHYFLDHVTFPKANFTSILDDCAGDDIDAWTLLGNLPSITQLRVRNVAANTIRALCQGMHVEQSDTVAGPDPHPAFPALTTLAIRSWKFEEICDKTTIAEKLLDCVKLRAKANLPIKWLKIKCCSGCEKKNVLELREVIDVVDWDGDGCEDVEEEWY